MSRTCEKCHAVLPVVFGPGRRRKYCVTCAPALSAAKEKPMSDLMVIAHNAQEMATAQASLTTWAEAKIAECRAAYNELDESLTTAKKNKWAHRPIANAVSRMAKELQFYEKLNAAIGEGYVIVPNFPIDVFAIRTNRTRPLPKTVNYWGSSHQQESESPAMGEGEYRSADPTVRKEEWKESGKDGAIVVQRAYTAVEFKDVLMPFKAVKPTLMKDLERGMMGRIFDEIGIAPQAARKDPMLIGQVIYRPTGHRVSFLLAWWLSSADLEV